MAEIERVDAVRGKTMRWAWTDGPTRGKTYEHRFGEDGTVTWRSVEPGESGTPEASADVSPRERAEYAAARLMDGLYLVSYLAPSGFTLTVAVNLLDQTLVGFASNDTSWFPVRGTVELCS